MSSKPSLKNRIELLHDSDALSSEQYAELHGSYRAIEEVRKDVFSILEILPQDFYGPQRVHIECKARRHKWRKAGFAIHYWPMGDGVKEECRNCSRKKVTTINALGMVNSVYSVDTAGYALPNIGRPLTKWELSVLDDYLTLLETVEELEATFERKHKRQLHAVVG